MSEKIKKWYRMGLWTAPMVENAVRKGILTAAEASAITGGEGGDAHGSDVQPEN